MRGYLSTTEALLVAAAGCAFASLAFYLFGTSADPKTALGLAGGFTINAGFAWLLQKILP